jgi:hypothetical protein
MNFNSIFRPGDYLLETIYKHEKIASVLPYHFISCI